MKLHANHRTCPSSRLLICRRVLEEGWTLRQAAEAAGCSVRTAAKWVVAIALGRMGCLTARRGRIGARHVCPSSASLRLSVCVGYG
jgi:hypothetical protein